MQPSSLQHLRTLVHDCLAKHMYEAAVFYADKLVTLTDHAPAEVYTLAQGFYCSGQHRRCLHLLRSAQLIDKDVRIRYLAARCIAWSLLPAVPSSGRVPVCALVWGREGGREGRHPRALRQRNPRRRGLDHPTPCVVAGGALMIFG